MNNDAVIAYFRYFPEDHSRNAPLEQSIEVVRDYVKKNNLDCVWAVADTEESKVPRSGVKSLKGAMRKYRAKGLVVARHDELVFTPEEADEILPLFQWMDAKNRILHIAGTEWNSGDKPRGLAAGLLAAAFNKGVREGEDLAKAH